MENNPAYIHETAIIDRPCTIGDGTKIWHFAHVMEGCTIGENCILGQNVFLGKGVSLGNFVKVQNNVSLYAGVICDDAVFIGPSAVFTNILTPRSMVERKDQFKETHLQYGCSIGANATILCGLSIGKFALIGAGSVVTRPVPNYALVYGNPARQMGWVSERGHKLNFGPSGEACCPESGEKYRLKNGSVSKLK